MSFGRAMDKVRQAFNILLILLLIVAVAGTIIWVLTPAEQMNATFWISMGAMAFTLLLGGLFAMRIAFRENAGRDVTGNFSQFLVLAVYFLFAVGLSIANVYMQFSVTVYFLIHVAGAAVFFVPLLLTNMAMLKLSGAERREQKQGRQSLALRAAHLRDLTANLERSANIAGDRLHPLRKLADNLQYSDPNPGPGKVETALDRALGNLDEAVSSLTSLASLENLASPDSNPSNSGGADSNDSMWRAVLDACAAAEQALNARNAAVLNSK